MHRMYKHVSLEKCSSGVVFLSIGVYLSYIFLGLTLAAPIGQVNAARLDKGLKCGFMHAWMIGVGSTIADIIYMLLVYLGLVNFLQYPPIQTFLWLFGAFVLLFSGVESIKESNKITLTYKKKEESLFKCFISGFILSFSSPLSILFWIGIYGSVLAKSANVIDSSQLLLYSILIFVGLSLWDLIAALIANLFRNILTSKSIILISILSGVSLIAFGIYFGYEGIKSLIG